jgi:SpoVK/Ycf46/Vps4 family AAA+-type ATPase
MHLAGKPGADELDYGKITAASVGYSGAEIQHIVNKVAMESLKAAMSGEGGKSLATSDILDAIRITPAQVSPELVAVYDAIATRLSR